MSTTKKNKKRARVNPDQAALDMVNDYVAATRSQLAILLSQPERYADALNRVDPHLPSQERARWVTEHSGMTDDEIAARYQFGSLHGSDYTCLRAWQQHPSLIRLHPTTLAAVVESESPATALPGNQLLPRTFFAPLIALPQPILLPAAITSGETNALGVMASAVSHERYDLLHLAPALSHSFNDVRVITSPDHLDSANCLIITFLGRSCDASGRLAPDGHADDLNGQRRTVTPTVSVRISTPLTDMTYTDRFAHALKQIIDTSIQDIADGHLSLYQGMDDLETSTNHLLHTGLSVAMYLSTAESTTDTSPARTYTLDGTRRCHPAVTVHSVGFTTGRLIAKSTTSTHTPTTPSTDPTSSRRSPRAHHRRGHWRAVWRGHGEHKVKGTAWITPVEVKGRTSSEPLIVRDPGPATPPTPQENITKGTAR